METLELGDVKSVSVKFMGSDGKDATLFVPAADPKNPSIKAPSVVHWTSSNELAVSVVSDGDNAKITAVGLGTAHIEAQAPIDLGKGGSTLAKAGLDVEVVSKPGSGVPNPQVTYGGTISSS